MALELGDGRSLQVERLITVATPHQGSSLARFPVSVDGWDAIVDGRDTRVADLFADGLNEARDDLRPESKLIRRLSSAKRNPNVRYSILRGRQGLVQASELGAVRRQVRVYARRFRVLRAFGPKLDAHLNDLDEIVDELGDGVVSLSRAALDGVDDIVTLDFHHWALTDQFGDFPELRSEIAKRLKGLRAE